MGPEFTGIVHDWQVEIMGVKWKATIEVADDWLEDGFVLTAENLRSAINELLLGYANPSEIIVTVEGPDASQVESYLQQRAQQKE